MSAPNGAVKHSRSAHDPHPMAAWLMMAGLSLGLCRDTSVGWCKLHMLCNVECCVVGPLSLRTSWRGIVGRAAPEPHVLYWMYDRWTVPCSLRVTAVDNIIPAKYLDTCTDEYPPASVEAEQATRSRGSAVRVKPRRQASRNPDDP